MVRQNNKFIMVIVYKMDDQINENEEEVAVS